MSERTNIEWCDSTFNPWIGCTKVSPGCDHCYAERQDARGIYGGKHWGAGVPRKRTSAAYWRQPLRWNERADIFRECGGCGWRGEIVVRAEPVPFDCPECGRTDWRDARRRVFCASMSDWLDNKVPASWRADLFDLIRRTPNLNWLLLTKRIGNAERMIDEAGGWAGGGLRTPLPHVWLGATVVNQEEADRDIPKLLATPARVRFLSIEPMLGPVNLDDIDDWSADMDIQREYWIEDFDTEDSPPAVGHNALTGERWQRFGEWSEYGPRLDWVIVGAESCPGARPSHPNWFRSLRDQCAAARVPFMLKQNGEFAECTAANCDARIHRFVELDGTDSTHWKIDRHTESTAHMVRVGKKAAGRMLDGRTHDEFPHA